MSANLNYNRETGKYAFASAKEVAWHQTGTILDHVMTAEEAMSNAQLNYVVAKQPIFAEHKVTTVGLNGEINEEVKKSLVPEKFATLRTDTMEALGVVGNRYRILQNKDAFKFFDNIVGEGQAIYETAGALGKGERVFITAKLPKKLVIAPDDAIDQYLFITNSHDGSSNIEVAFTPTRIVCANTLSIALKNSSHQVRIRHTESAGDKLAEAHKVMGIAIRKGEDMEEAYQRMSKVRITDNQVKKLIQLAMNPKSELPDEEEQSTKFRNTVDSVMEYAMTDDTQLLETCKGTLYGAVQAVSGYYNNVVNYKTADSKLKGIIYGTAMNHSNKAYNLGIDVLTGKTTLN